MKKGAWSKRKKLLTGPELKHLHGKDGAACRTKQDFIETVIFQETIRQKPDFKPLHEPCWECKVIARKLGLIE